MVSLQTSTNVKRTILQSLHRYVTPYQKLKLILIEGRMISSSLDLKMAQFACIRSIRALSIRCSQGALCQSEILHCHQTEIGLQFLASKWIYCLTLHRPLKSH